MYRPKFANIRNWETDKLGPHRAWRWGADLYLFTLAVSILINELAPSNDWIVLVISVLAATGAVVWMPRAGWWYEVRDRTNHANIDRLALTEHNRSNVVGIILWSVHAMLTGFGPTWLLVAILVVTSSIQTYFMAGYIRRCHGSEDLSWKTIARNVVR